MRYFIRLSYDGSAFNGWQIQPSQPSVQEALQKALGTLLKTEVIVTGAGRTDTGVNAAGYAAHFDLPEGMDFDRGQIGYKLNAILGPQICVHGIETVSEELHARFSASEREYCYFIHRRKDPFMGKYSWLCGYPLDLEKMNRAAEHLLGTHDFSSFEKSGGNNATSICTVRHAVWQAYEPSHVRLMGYPHAEGDYIYFRIRADRYLRNMVRAIVGSLVDVGRGKHDPEWILELLERHDRCAAGESVPGNALFLSHVDYPTL